MRRRRQTGSILVTASALLGALTAAPAAAAEKSPPPGADGLSAYTVEFTRDQAPLLLRAGADGHEIGEKAPRKGTATAELVLTSGQAAKLRDQGVKLTERRLSEQARSRVEQAGDGVFRPYSGPGGLREEILETSRAHPELTKVVSIGKTVKGQDILAVKVSKDADKVRDGAKPSVLYSSNQHAREWITPEMTRRLMHHYLDGYGKDEQLTRIVDTTELWFVISANPDGYDFTFTPGNRLWRKNLRDNNKDGRITPGDGVDLNRNFAYKWGYDNEGSSPDPANETYRGPKPSSEPETRALDGLEKRIGFEYGINYHSAAQLLLYGVGWQVATPTPDDVLYRALAGTPEKSAIPGYRPQVSSELYTTNGEADGHAANVNGTMMFTPEMSTCATASRVDPDDAWEPADCESGFNFPDDEKLIRQEFEKNLPFAVAVARTAAHPDRPVSPVDMEAPDFTPDAFTTSYARGGHQEVSVTARRSIGHKRLEYRIDDGRTRTAPLKAWKGGERYGGDDNLHFDEYRAEVKGAKPGDRVTVRFTGRDRDGSQTASEPFTYTVAERPRADVLVLAEEGGTDPARHASAYTRALADSGRKAVVWDVATQGAPDPLGVLAHFPTVVWYTGAGEPGGDTLLAVRDHLNEGGKLVMAGERAGGSSRVGRASTDDFSQYYLGAGGRVSLASPPRFAGSGELRGTEAELGDADGNPLNGAGSYSVISDELAPRDFPLFRSSVAGDYPGVRTPFEPYDGEWFAAAEHADNSWMRLTRTVDLTGTTGAEQPGLEMMISHDLESDYDNVIVEAHTVGEDDWTTLPDTRGGTSTEVPADCEEGFYLRGHPFLEHYLTLDEDACRATGSTGEWNRFTGSSDGWRAAAFDLSAYAGKRVELSVSYVTDPGSGGRGVFVDDTRLVTGGTGTDDGGFEQDLGPWSVSGPPPGSPENRADWKRSGELFRSSAAVTTRDTVLLGFGLEHVRTAGDRTELIRGALRALRR